MPVLIVTALLVGTWAVRHHALLRLFDQPEPRRRPDPAARVTSLSFSDEDLRELVERDEESLSPVSSR
ncbi:hypothetical protein [Umezawaea sp.]|uniref:hypothetical protein n=1 Tax=Umezawaea sp. TaxID=1955258 RepID=UPI002ED4B4FA